MKAPINKQRLTNLLKGIQKSIDLFDSQGHSNVFFTAQFFRGGRKQNGIERGDISTFAKQLRTYVNSEEADSARIEFFDESTGKSIYSKALNDLRIGEEGAAGTEAPAIAAGGLGGYSGLGEAEVMEIVDRRVTEARRQDEFQRLNKEVDELRSRAGTLETEKEELEAVLKAKKDTEYYMGIIGAAFPGLAPLFTGTPLAQAAGFLAGTTDLNGKALPAPKPDVSEEVQSISTMVAEFCNTLTTQEASAIHLLFMAFESDRKQIQRALQYITTQHPN